MTRYAYVAVGPDGQIAKGIEKADSREGAELALYDRELRDISVSESKTFLQVDVLAKRVKREEVMHLSRQLAAFIRAGLPFIDAVHTIGVEAKTSSVRRMMADVEDGLRRGRAPLGVPRPAPQDLSRLLPGHPPLGGADRPA